MADLNDTSAVLQAELNDIEAMFAELAQAVGMDMKEELLALFFPTLDECSDGLRQAIPAADSAKVLTLAHKLKGAAGQLGATRIAAYCRAIESAAKNNDLAVAQSEFVALQDLAEKVSAQLRGH